MEKVVEPKAKEKKKPSFGAKLMKAIRMSMWRRKVFIGTYWDNEAALEKFIIEKNVIIIDVNRGTDKIHQFDFRLADTRAQKKDRRLILHYIRDHWVLRTLGYIGNGVFGIPYRDNGFCRMLGFKNNMVERMKYRT